MKIVLKKIIVESPSWVHFLRFETYFPMKSRQHILTVRKHAEKRKKRCKWFFSSIKFSSIVNNWFILSKNQQIKLLCTLSEICPFPTFTMVSFIYNNIISKQIPLFFTQLFYRCHYLTLIRLNLFIFNLKTLFSITEPFRFLNLRVQGNTWLL